MKQYDRSEIGAILKKAAENSSTDTSEIPAGLSLDELRQIASDAGIDPDQIARAVAEVEGESSKSERTFWGGPFSFSSQVIAEGEIGSGEWEEMLISIREFFQSKGEVTSRESVREWSSPWGTTNSAQVTARTDHGKTKISVGWNGPLTAVPFYIPVPLVAIASVFFASEFLELTAVPGVAFALLATGFTFLAGRWALRRHLATGFKKLQHLVARLDRIASRENPQPEGLLNQMGQIQMQAERTDPILQIPEDEDGNEVDPETTPRNRSRA
ncbi:MAG: hypothetical protein Rubg2KO_07460 [Rubricoccaceae bacterium]